MGEFGGARRAFVLDDEEKKPTDDLSGIAEAYQKAAPIMDAVWQLIGSVAFGVLVGYFLDKHFGTAPWILVGGSVLGMTAGMIAFIRNTLRNTGGKSPPKKK